MTKAELMQKVRATIDRRGEEIVALGEAIRRQPELGFKEFKTAQLIAQAFERMGLAPRTGLALTGVRADVAGRAGDGPTIALFGELDGLVVVGHPVADPETGAAHACGHNAQVAGMLGAAMALLEVGAFDHLAGRVAFVGVPAEEYGDVEWRVAQRDAGRLEFMGGKPEMLRLGHLDDVDMGMMIHATPRREEGKLAVPMSNNGCVVKTVRYVGRASHAGGAPHLGVNALYAAQIGLMAINALRETFRDEDTIRVHPIITHGGSQVNVPGYMPLHCDPLMVERFRTIAADLVGADNVRTILHRTGSTDMGDLAQVMPIIHPYVGGAKGTPHGADYEIVDPALTYLTNAKALASMVIDLLADGAAVGRQVVAQAKPPLTRQGYLDFQRKTSRRETYDGATTDH